LAHFGRQSPRRDGTRDKFQTAIKCALTCSDVLWRVPANEIASIFSHGHLCADDNMNRHAQFPVGREVFSENLKNHQRMHHLRHKYRHYIACPSCQATVIPRKHQD